MHGHGLDRLPRSAQPAIKLQGEHQVGQLALAVETPALVAALGIQILEVKAADAVGEAADRYHARGLGFAQPVQKQSGEGKMAQVIGPELHLEAVPGVLERRRHDPGVVKQDIQLRVMILDALGKVPHRGQVRQVQLHQVEVQFRVPRPETLDGRMAFLAVAARHDDVGAPAGQHARALQPEPTVGAGDQHCSAGEVRNVPGRPWNRLAAHGVSLLFSPFRHRLYNPCR